MVGIICSSVPKVFYQVEQKRSWRNTGKRVKSSATLKSIHKEEKLRVENPSGNKSREVSGEAGEVDFA